MRLVRLIGKALLYIWDGLRVWCPICLICKRPGCSTSCPIQRLGIRIGARLEDLAYGPEGEEP